jgi:hypothetical protein
MLFPGGRRRGSGPFLAHRAGLAGRVGLKGIAKGN